MLITGTVACSASASSVSSSPVRSPIAAALRVLTWNLYHGRSRPAQRRSLLREFAAALASWEWDVALLQEVPPWWPPGLARACDADARSVLTSRNELPWLRRALAV